MTDSQSDQKPKEEDLERRRKRILFRANHMGMAENDILFGKFAKRFVADFDEDKIAQFEVLLKIPDNDLFNWVTEKEEVGAEADNDVFRMIMQFKKDISA